MPLLPDCISRVVDHHHFAACVSAGSAAAACSEFLFHRLVGLRLGGASPHVVEHRQQKLVHNLDPGGLLEHIPVRLEGCEERAQRAVAHLDSRVNGQDAQLVVQDQPQLVHIVHLLMVEIFLAHLISVLHNRSVLADRLARHVWMEVDFGKRRKQCLPLTSEEIRDVPQQCDRRETDVEIRALESKRADGGEEELETIDGQRRAVGADELHAVERYAHMPLLLVLRHTLEHRQHQRPRRPNLLAA
mmetsp:Transcript_53433/g.126381  ORF Transcript_53433/g.126381 Transcript_53433/m.126381 type:complete len:245 (+) Transcript_53433:1812-2546(+)